MPSSPSPFLSSLARRLVALAALSLATAILLPGRGGAEASPATIPAGPSRFEAALPRGQRIAVFAYRAAGPGPAAPIVIVLPGAGRNGDDYRDSWIEAADRHDLLVLAPTFDEAQFPGPIAYNLAGMIRGTADATALREVVPTPAEQWLFAGIEAVFDQAVARTGSGQSRYDLFGHSAGGQIVHRMVMFAPEARIRTAIAANSGWYTTVSADIAFPYGLGGWPMPPGQIETAFARRLVILLGARDDASERRGHLRHTPETDAQGLHRLARGRHFHDGATTESARRRVPLNWRLEIVPGVGHDHQAMGIGAAALLYDGETPTGRN